LQAVVDAWPALPAVDDLDAWKALQALIEAAFRPLNQQVVEKLEPELREDSISGIPVLDIRPKGWNDDGRLLVHLHGGAYIGWSTKSSLNASVPMADATGMRVISVEYTLAPFARWNTILGEVISAIRGLLDRGCGLDAMGFFGESAGGSMAASVALKMRDDGIGMPGALVLMSPWSDITDTGDTYATLRDADPAYLYELHLGPAALAYADAADLKHPYVSPVYGDYSKGSPPTLIQGGTKEIFLSNFVRHYRALDQAGQTVELDLYEGMIHAFSCEAPFLPESQLAREKARDFLDRHLRSPKR
jgi:monoterpene epsilon-lactone hydrolase